MNRPALVLFVVLTAWLAQGCAMGSPSAVTPAAPAGGSTQVRDEIYFGADIPTGGEVTDDMWEAFLDTEVTPRFPEGFTSLDSTGRYRYETGEIVRERGWVIVVFHPSTDENERKVIELMAAYKKKFAQESVLRVTTLGTVRFYQ